MGKLTGEVKANVLCDDKRQVTGYRQDGSSRAHGKKNSTLSEAERECNLADRPVSGWASTLNDRVMRKRRKERSYRVGVDGKGAYRGTRERKQLP